jgi:hypothetical protein
MGDHGLDTVFTSGSMLTISVESVNHGAAGCRIARCRSPGEVADNHKRRRVRHHGEQQGEHEKHSHATVRNVKGVPTPCAFLCPGDHWRGEKTQMPQGETVSSVRLRGPCRGTHPWGSPTSLTTPFRTIGDPRRKRNRSWLQIWIYAGNKMDLRCRRPPSAFVKMS